MHSVCPDLVHMQSEGTRMRRTSTSVAFDSSCLPSAPRVPSPASAQSVQNSSVKTRVSFYLAGERMDVWHVHAVHKHCDCDDKSPESAGAHSHYSST